MPLRLVGFFKGMGFLGSAGLGALAVVALVGIYWAGHINGKAAERLAAEARMVSHLQELIEQHETIRQQDMEILSGVVERETRIVREVERVEVPVSDCSQLGDDWLRAYNAIIEAAGGSGAFDDAGGSTEDR